MSVTLPLRSDLPHYTFQVELDGASYEFEIRWNDMAAGWIMSIFTSDSQPIVTGLRLVVDWSLAGRYADARLPPGKLIAQDTSGAHADPTRDDLGSRVILLYFSEAEVEAL